MSDAKTLGDKVVDYVLNNEIRRLRDINKVLLEACEDVLITVAERPPLFKHSPRYKRLEAAIRKAREGR